MLIFLIIESIIGEHLTESGSAETTRLSTKIRCHLSRTNTPYQLVTAVTRLYAAQARRRYAATGNSAVPRKIVRRAFCDTDARYLASGLIYSRAIALRTISCGLARSVSISPRAEIPAKISHSRNSRHVGSGGLHVSGPIDCPLCCQYVVSQAERL